MLVDCTGGGKSHILQTIATFVGGIIVVIVPLLALTVDQMAKIEEALQDCGSVSAVHLNKLSRAKINSDFIPRMHEIGYDSSPTMFVSISLQKLANTPTMFDALLMCHARQTLRLITIDEAHLYAQHGSTFHDVLHILGQSFFSVTFKDSSWHSLFLAMTTTMTKQLLTALSTLTNVDWTNKKHQLWDKCEDFQQRHIKVSFQVCGHMSHEAFPLLAQYLKEKPNGSAFVSINFRSKVAKCEESLEGMLIAAKLDIDLIMIYSRSDHISRAMT